VATLMTEFPPAPEDQVSLANWREAPFNRWSFRHVREIIPTADIAHDPHRVRPLPIGLVDTDKIRIRGARGRVLSLNDFLMAASTDSLVILHRGRIIVERYADGMTAETPHILMSVSKSVLGLLTGILVSEGILDPEGQVTIVIPEVSETAYQGATIRHLLDMRTGVAFDEDYTATSGLIVEYRKATNWHPSGPGDCPSDLRSSYQGLRAPDGKHGGRFHYVSPNSDLLGWVIERATGQRFADLMSRYIWKPMECAAQRVHHGRPFGCAAVRGWRLRTARDLARLGQVVADGGACGGTQIIPTAWIDDIARNGSADAWDAGVFAPFFPGRKIRSPVPPTRSISPAARRLLTHPRIRHTQLKICSTDAPARAPLRWMSARPDTLEHIIVEFDQPQTISRLVYGVEEAV
jgi:CubicO group peptidase (beta-lactamase class C family)